MDAKKLVLLCEELGLNVSQVPATGRRSYNANGNGVLVYWSTSYEGGMLGLPRVAYSSRDTHARNFKEVGYLVKAGLDSRSSGK